MTFLLPAQRSDTLRDDTFQSSPKFPCYEIPSQVEFSRTVQLEYSRGPFEYHTEHLRGPRGHESRKCFGGGVTEVLKLSSREPFN